MKRLLFISAALAMAGFAAAFGAIPADAADFIAPAGDDGAVTINRTETHHNLYVAGGDISVTGPTTGDLYSAGGWISVDGPVEQDAVVAGGTIIISEPVNGDVRIAGGKVTINAPVKGDVLVFGGSLTLTDKASVGGELRAFGGTITANGPVAGGAYLTGGTITVNSKIDGPVKITASESLVFGSGADIASEVSYRGKNDAVMSEGAKARVSFTELTRDRHDKDGFLGFIAGSQVVKFFAVVLAGLLALYLFKKPAYAVAESMRARPWANLGIGFVAVIAVPIAIIISLILVVGYYIALIAAMAYILALLAASLIAAIFLGAWIVKLLTKKPNLALDWQAVVIGTVTMMLLKFIPAAGWLVCIALFLTAFGALINTFLQYLKHSRAASTPTSHDAPGTV